MGRDAGGWASGLVGTLAMKDCVMKIGDESFPLKDATLTVEPNVIPGEVDMVFNGPPPKGSAWAHAMPVEVKTLPNGQRSVDLSREYVYQSQSAWNAQSLNVPSLSEVQSAADRALSKKANWVVEKLIERLKPLFDVTVEPAAWQRLFELKGAFEYDSEIGISRALEKLTRIAIDAGCGVINDGRSIVVQAIPGMRSNHSDAHSRLDSDRSMDEPRGEVQRRAIFRRDPLGDA